MRTLASWEEHAQLTDYIVETHRKVTCGKYRGAPPDLRRALKADFDELTELCKVTPPEVRATSPIRFVRDWKDG